MWSTGSPDPGDTHNQIMAAYSVYAPELKTDWKVGLLTNPMLVDEVKNYSNHPELDTAAENIVRKVFHGAPDMDAKLVGFFTGLREFHGKEGRYNRTFIWNDGLTLKLGETHKWHKQYSDPRNSAFGQVAVLAQSFLTGMGAGERNWKDVKHVWDKKRPNLDPQRAEKEVRIFESCRRRDRLGARVTDDLSESPLFKVWSKEEMNYDLGMEKFGISIDEAAIDQREVMNWVEDWEPSIIKDHRKINEFKLLEKYGNLVFIDEDDDQLYKIWPLYLEWKKKDKHNKETPCYCVLANPIDEDSDHADLFKEIIENLEEKKKNKNTNTDKEEDPAEEFEAFHINANLHAMIGAASGQQEKTIKLLSRGT